MQQQRSDNDSPWKLILREYFSEAMEFFFPHIAELVDWTRPIEFLDKEFQQLSPDAEVGKRYADQLVRVYRKQGTPLILLLHLEVQAAPEKHFAERMLIYALRIYDYFHQPATSLAILCDKQADWRPTQHVLTSPGTQIAFDFTSVKLLDYQNRWADLEASRNPFATVVMAHLKTQSTKPNTKERKDWKLFLIRRLYEMGYTRSQILNLFKFVDWAMLLSERQKQAFWTELKEYEEQRKMPYITSVEEIGFARGQEVGQQRGERSLTLLQLTQKFGTLSDETVERISALNSEQLQALAIALLNFTSLDQLTQWLESI
jgi:hypothetical protein